MTLAPTLGSVEALYRRLERESYRAYHARKRLHKADHFFNFCVTAHALRDYFFKGKGIADKKKQESYHRLWNRNPALVAVREIANTSKHFRLQRTPRTRRVRTKVSDFVYVLASSDGRLRFMHVRAPDITVTLSDGTRLELYQFTHRVLRYWRSYLRRQGIRIQRQPFRQLTGHT